MFWINLPLGLLAFFVSRRALAQLAPPKVERRIDYPAPCCCRSASAALLVGITRIGQGVAGADATNLQLFGAARWCWRHSYGSRRARPNRYCRSTCSAYPTIALCCSILFIAFAQVVSLSVLIPLRLQMLTGSGAEGAALQLVPLSLAIPLGALSAAGAWPRAAVASSRCN